MPPVRTNGFDWDFSSCFLGLLNLKQLPEELMSFTFGDGISRPDIEGTSQVPIGAGRGRYKCDNVAVKSTLAAYREVVKAIPKKDHGNYIFPVVLTLQSEGTKPLIIEFPECSIIKQPFNFQQNDPSLTVGWEMKSRYMLFDNRCLGNISR